MISKHSTLTGWGLGQGIQAVEKIPASEKEAKGLLNHSRISKQTVIARGLGRSYGDASLQKTVFSSRKLNRFLSWEEKRAELVLEAGVSLEEILRIFVPKGFILPVLPGTKWVSVGGAISSDVHGKSHHRDGSFSSWVNWIEVLLASGKVIRCSRLKNQNLFRAVCGGMGLMGLILRASLKLKKIETSYFLQNQYRAGSLDTLLSLFEKHGDAPYSVAWIDTMAKGNKSGKGFLTTGYPLSNKNLPAHADWLNPHAGPKIGFPFFLPSGWVGPFVLRLAIRLYGLLPVLKGQSSIVHYDPFFFPLDGIHLWNRAYGRKGFQQHQSLFPKNTSRSAIEEILKLCQGNGFPSLVTVLKLFGPGNKNLLSFPEEGFTLCLDFPSSPGLPVFLKKLDAVVLRHGGRIYLAKDASMSREVFRAGYRNWKQFRRFKTRLDPKNSFASLQSSRLGLS